MYKKLHDISKFDVFLSSVPPRTSIIGKFHGFETFVKIVILELERGSVTSDTSHQDLKMSCLIKISFCRDLCVSLH